MRSRTNMLPNREKRPTIFKEEKRSSKRRVREEQDDTWEKSCLLYQKCYFTTMFKNGIAMVGRRHSKNAPHPCVIPSPLIVRGTYD